MSIGVWQVILILVIVLIIFGAGKLPKVMGDVAKGIKNFKSGMTEPEKEEEKDEDKKTIEGQATHASTTSAAPSEQESKKG